MSQSRLCEQIKDFLVGFLCFCAFGLYLVICGAVANTFDGDWFLGMMIGTFGLMIGVLLVLFMQTVGKLARGSWRERRLSEKDSA